MKRTLSMFVLPLLALTSASWSQSAEKTNEANGKAYVAGQQVAIDPATGRLRPPTAEERRALAAAMKQLVNRSTAGLRVRTHANGMQSVDLEGRFLSVATASTDADGKIRQSCVTDEKGAKALAAKTGTPARHSEVR
jgi:hypothetical protein